MWDFDGAVTEVAARINTSKIFGKPIRAYYEGKPLPVGAPAGSVLIDAQARRWSNYVERGPIDPKEVPPLPPERTNSSTVIAHDGHDGPHRVPPNPPSTFPTSGYTHHLIRDFMFLDAAATNRTPSGPLTPVTPSVPQQFTVQFKPLDPASFVGGDSEVGEFTRGTGHQTASNKHLLDIASAPVLGNGLLAYRHGDVSFATLLYELVDLTNKPVDSNEFSPNWFGVAVPDGITDFTNVVIYFHPTPGQAEYFDADYPSKSNGGNPAHANWKELLGYVDRLGSQLAGAVKFSGATPNQIVIVPFMRNQNIDQGHRPLEFGGTGILARQWYYIVNDILKDIPARLLTA